MRTSWIIIPLLSLLFVGQAVAANESVEIRASKPGAVVNVEQTIGDDKVIISVVDSANNPMFGLTNSDFVVTMGGRTARIISVQPIAESLEVPRNIVMVLDNSSSMRQRKAVEPLLAGVDELLKVVRPIDQVQIVVFSKGEKVEMGGRELRVRTFKSNQRDDLKNFVADVYSDGITSKTMLYEGMLAGLELVRTMPENEPRFMVVFSDGEDLNSAFNRDDVMEATEGLPRFSAYAIDYMPSETTDKFLMTFAEQNHGQIWKATSETDLVSIFQSVASKMEYYYMVSYLFPTTGSLTVAPTSVSIDEVEAVDPSSQDELAPGTPARSVSAVSRIDASALTLRPVVDTFYNIVRWKAVITNADGTLAVQSGDGIPAAEIVVPLNTEDLGGLAAGGDITVAMEVQDSKGQGVILSSPPVKVNYFRTTGSLSAVPASLTIEEIKTIDSSPMLGHIYFAEGASDIPEHYMRLAGPDGTESFDEQRFRDTLEKYYQVLNIIGKRMFNNPPSVITLTGCNANKGVEKGNRKLSTARAEAVRDYLQMVWNIAPERILIEARNLPEMPSTSRLEEGKADNRRVEIRSDDSAILAPVLSTYFATRMDTEALTLYPVVDAAHGVERWTATVANNSEKLGEPLGEGPPPSEITVPLPTTDLNALGAGGDINVTMTVQDRKGQEMVLTTSPVRVNFFQTSELLTQKRDFRMQEKYALILFDFDSDVIDARNQEIVNAIVARIRELPQATVDIVGHTDNIGKEDYNIKLSERRALAVYKLLTEAYGEDLGERIRYRGVGPNDPLYDNSTSEARAFNRTVTITLEYMAEN